MVNIADGRAAAYQIRRYCWSAGLPFGLVTDFEEFALYDCRAIPEPTDSPMVGRIGYFTCNDLEEKWALLVGMFGKEAVQGGSLERLAANAKPPRNTRPIDQAFLEEIRSWRRLLAADIARRNEFLDTVDLSRTVQTLIDRLVFLRIAEARGLEAVGALQKVTDGSPGVYARLMRLFKRADDRYNSGLFHFKAETDSSAPHDIISPKLKVDDALLKKIVKRLYYPEPYEFSVLPADLLGRIYEQFLGEVVTLKADRTTTVELKPENRKAGGVYYTPVPIVDYIVEETLGPLLRGKTPAEVAKIRVVDPACGSGSFLIAAYQYILDWHTDYYATSPRLAKQNLEQGADGQLRVRSQRRKRILLNNIFGVDIDPQAVEVSKLSLLLKVIEGQAQMELDVGRILPDLDRNVVCGNSLIGSDFPMPFALDRLEMLAYNPFDWADAFPAVFKAGGFDAVIGNPPYLNVDNVWGKNDPRLAYIKAAYADVYMDKTDILIYFLKKAVDICPGEIGFIVSRSFLEADKAQNLRGWLSQNVKVREILDFRHARVFPKVGINTAIIRLTKSRAVKQARFARFTEQQLPPGYLPSTLRDPKSVSAVAVPLSVLGSKSWNFGEADVRSLLAKLDAAGDPVGEILHVGKGMETGRNVSFRFDVGLARARQLGTEGLLYPRLRNSDIGRYVLRNSGINLLYVENVKTFRQLPEDVRSHLRSHKAELEKRAAYTRGNCDWWRFTWPLHKEYMSAARIWCPYRADTNRFSLDKRADYLGLTDTTVLYDASQPEDLRYVLGVLNSRVLTARFRFIGKLLGGGVFEYYENTVRQLPIPRRAPGDTDHDAIVNLVRKIEQVIVSLSSTRILDEQDALEKERAGLDHEIETRVQSLFGLTQQDVALLEEQLES
jgi:Eco57I restriction-modification methylase